MLRPLPVLGKKLAPQQAPRVIRNAPQPLLRGHLLFAVERLRSVCRVTHRLQLARGVRSRRGARRLARVCLRRTRPLFGQFFGRLGKLVSRLCLLRRRRGRRRLLRACLGGSRVLARIIFTIVTGRLAFLRAGIGLVRVRRSLCLSRGGAALAALAIFGGLATGLALLRILSGAIALALIFLRLFALRIGALLLCLLLLQQRLYRRLVCPCILVSGIFLDRFVVGRNGVLVPAQFGERVAAVIVGVGTGRAGKIVQCQLIVAALVLGTPAPIGIGGECRSLGIVARGKRLRRLLIRSLPKIGPGRSHGWLRRRDQAKQQNQAQQPVAPECQR